MMVSSPKILLGSKSPRRQFLLKDAGFETTVIDIECEEDFSSALKAHEIPLFLAEKKNKAYTGPVAGNELLVTADTVVWLKGQVYNKPLDAEDSFRMLKELSGNTHTVYTAVSLRTSEKSYSFYDETEVSFNPVSGEEIEYYVHHFRPFDKAGSYGIQDWFGYRAIKGIKGCYYNVMGFPVAKFCEVLKEF